MTFSYKDRQQALAEAKNTTYDVLIIGGGITGAGVAVQNGSCRHENDFGRNAGFC